MTRPARRQVMNVDNPLADNAPSEPEDQNLVSRARAGDRKALEDLIERHQAWIYNIALRMLFHPEDAEDATQEILVKVLTRLSSFEGRSSFRTWLYRVAFNHSTPDLELADPKDGSPEANLLVTEVMLACTSGMLLCLDREQRLTYVLGAILSVSDSVGADVLEITAESFRQRLTRARRDLRNFMNDKRGLVNKSNPAAVLRRPAASFRRATSIRTTFCSREGE
jgi:DNA-directed RNA polymerase specialized sigma24 family protein